MNERPLIIDISEYQGQLNYNALNALPLDLLPNIIISRAGLGKYGHMKDKEFERNWSKSKQFGYYRQSYYAMYPGHPPQHQLNSWYDLAPEIDILPRVIDMEVNFQNQPAELIATIMWDWSCNILERDGHRPWIYSRKNIIDPWLASWTDEMLNAHYYYLAEYNNHRDQEEEGIRIPDRVLPNRVVAKQTADQMILGPNLPVVDRGRWLLGDAYQLDNWITTNYSGVPKPVGDCENNTRHIADNASFIQTNAAEIEKLKLSGASLEDGCKRNYEHFKDLQARVNEAFTDITTQAQEIEDLMDAIATVRYTIETQVAPSLKGMQKQLDNITIPETNHSHWYQRLFNRR